MAVQLPSPLLFELEIVTDWAVLRPADPAGTEKERFDDEIERAGFWMVQDCVAGFSRESTTFAVKLNAPDTLGVPEIAPVVEFNVRPGGKLPAPIENV